jgi:hypothetical protein
MKQKGSGRKGSEDRERGNTGDGLDGSLLVSSSYRYIYLRGS